MARSDVLGVRVDLESSVATNPHPRWFRTFGAPDTGIAARVVVDRSRAEPSWVWDETSDNLYCDYGQADVAGEPGIAYPAMIFAAEIARQQSGFFSIHASSVETASGGLLFLGDSGAGKTSLALSLCAHHGCGFIAADRTAIAERGNRLAADGVWPYFKIRPHTVSHLAVLDDALRRNAGTAGWLASENRQWDTKAVMSCEHLGLRGITAPVAISAIYDVRVMEGSRLTVTALAPRDRTFRLAGGLSDNSTGRFSMVDAGGQPLGTPFSYTSTRIRVQQARLLRAVTSIPYSRIRGDLGSISDYLVRTHHV